MKLCIKKKCISNSYIYINFSSKVLTEKVEIMQNKRSYRIASALLLFAYLNLITLTVFHFHVVNFNDQSASIASSHTEAQLVDPFSDGDSNCSVTQFSSSSYINVNNFFKLFFDISGVCVSTRSLF